MQDQYLIPKQEPSIPQWEAAEVAQGLAEQLVQFLYPLSVLLDKRLERTFLQLVQVIITSRDRANGLLLSELGSYLLSPGQAAAGTKRLSNLLPSDKGATGSLSGIPGSQFASGWLPGKRKAIKGSPLGMKVG